VALKHWHVWLTEHQDEDDGLSVESESPARAARMLAERRCAADPECYDHFTNGGELVTVRLFGSDATEVYHVTGEMIVLFSAEPEEQ